MMAELGMAPQRRRHGCLVDRAGTAPDLPIGTCFRVPADSVLKGRA
jgi:hypothetical protein